MSEESARDTDALRDESVATGKPASQIEAENPSDEVRAQEARELKSRLQGSAYDRTEADEEAETDGTAGAPAEG